jgi:DNA-binding MarR family transcriptional regulator
MAARKSATVEAKAADASSTVEDGAKSLAAELFWLQPRFTRWAMARVLQQPIQDDLSLQQLTVLYLVRTEGVTLAELARRTMVAPTVITGIVDRLERQHLIRREPDTQDRRVNRLVLTEAGHRVSLEVEQSLISEVENELAGFTEKELKTLREGTALLDRLVGSLIANRPK